MLIRSKEDYSALVDLHRAWLESFEQLFLRRGENGFFFRFRFEFDQAPLHGVEQINDPFRAGRDGNLLFRRFQSEAIRLARGCGGRVTTDARATVVLFDRVEVSLLLEIDIVK